mmetsp:Transcript_26723/g.48451  ORF Transcript_26723/g.48451 Transcript_26723/m.48451 type:complete len:82 (-) Transcript_26723:357-602(-)
MLISTRPNTERLMNGSADATISALCSSHSHERKVNDRMRLLLCNATNSMASPDSTKLQFTMRICFKLGLCAKEGINQLAVS